MKINITRFLNSAADLYLKLINFNDDSLASKHNKTFIAIDTDVLYFYLNPLDSVSYADPFDEDEVSSSAKSLAFLLSDFLINSNVELFSGHSNKKSRFLVFQPHLDELLFLLSIYHSRIDNSIADDDYFEKLKEIIDKYADDGNEELLVEALSSQVPKLVELFNPHRGASAALKRFSEIKDNTLRNIESYYDGEFAFQLLQSGTNDLERIKLMEMQSNWEKRLKKTKKRVKKRPISIRRDAEVLAQLEHLNNIHKDEDVKILFLTGSNYIFEAAKRYFPNTNLNNKENFCDLYIRHPQAFLGHENFFTHIDGKKSLNLPLAELLSIFFATNLKNASTGSKTVIPYSNKILRAIDNGHLKGKFDFVTSLYGHDRIFPEQLLENWNSQVASHAKLKYAEGLDFAEARGAIELARKMQKLKDKPGWSIDIIKHCIIEEANESISNLFSTSSWVGLWADAERKISKPVPAIKFEKRYEKIEIYCKQLVKLQLQGSAESNFKEKIVDFYRLFMEVEQLDTALYHTHVAHALAFAAKGNWKAAFTLSQLAMDISDIAADQEIRGREAAYIACVALRRSSLNKNDLANAHEYLEEAIKRENEGCSEDIRFTAERLVLKLRSYYYDIFCENIRLDKVEILDSVCDLEYLASEIPEDISSDVCLWVKRLIYTYFFTFLLISEEIYDSIIYDSDTINRFIDDFYSVLHNTDMHENDEIFKYDPYGYLIYCVAKAMWDSNHETQSYFRTRAIEIIKTWKVFYMEYDENRFAFLADCLKNPKSRCKLPQKETT